MIQTFINMKRLNEYMYVRVLGCMSTNLYVHVTHTHIHAHKQHTPHNNALSSKLFFHKRSLKCSGSNIWITRTNQHLGVRSPFLVLFCFVLYFCVCAHECIRSSRNELVYLQRLANRPILCLSPAEVRPALGINHVCRVDICGSRGFKSLEVPFPCFR